jgi:hypothetical protein
MHKSNENKFLDSRIVQPTQKEERKINQITMHRVYSLRNIKIETLRHLAFTNDRLSLSVLNGSAIIETQLRKLVKDYDKNYEKSKYFRI